MVSGDNLNFKMPESDEYGFVKTLNNTGYMTTYLDEFSQYWVDQCGQSSGLNADIGAAYGVATLAALKFPNAKVVAIDLDRGHLDVIEAKANEIDARDRVFVKAGQFPDDFHDFQNESLNNILICRLVHFFDGVTLQRAINWCFQKLGPGGRLVIVSETPYLRNFQEFIPIYEKRRKNGDEFPGFISDVKAIAPERAQFLPAQMHLLDEEVLSRVCKNAGLIIERTGLIARPNFPIDIQLDGRESVGVIACKPK